MKSLVADGTASFAAAEACERANKDATQAMRSEIERQTGGLAQFHARLRIEPLVLDSASLDAFYTVLRSSILPDELVPVDDFIAALGPKNADTAFCRAFGPYRYFALAMIAPSHGIIGAAGFAVFCHHDGPATLHASYYALLPPFRGLGLVSPLLRTAAETAVRFAAQARPTSLAAGLMIEFIEANDIAKMTLANRLLDQAIAMHPIARDAFWERVGFRELVGVEYRQRSNPPLELALKALLIELDRGDGSYRLRGTAPPSAILGQTVLRHISVFDSLLMNYDAIARVLSAGHKLPTPVGAKLLADIDPRMLLAVRPTQQAADARSDWGLAEAQLRRYAALPHQMTMQALRDQYCERPANDMARS